jgi:GT2 family glycosyltransferase
MNVSVIICTCNRYELISNTLDSICKNNVEPYELIIVDQSDDKPRVENIINNYRSSINLKLIPDNKKGLSRARNIGWRAAAGEIIAFTDDDAYVDQKWIEKIFYSFTIYGENIGIVGGKILPVFEEKNPHWEMPEKWSYLYPAYDSGEYIGEYKNNELPPGVNFATLKKILIEAGGFNERLGVIAGKRFQIYGEDSEIAIKAKSLGYRVLYNSNVIVYHPVPLGRQNQEFLNKRLFIEGSTQMYLSIKMNTYTFKQKLFLFISILRKHIEIKNDNNINKIEYHGIKNFYKGKLFILFVTGILGLEI